MVLSTKSKACLITSLIAACVTSTMCGDNKTRNIRDTGTLPYCTRGATSDVDGDGFGLERNKVCLVKDGKIDLAQKPTLVGNTTAKPKEEAKPAATKPKTQPEPAAPAATNPAPSEVPPTPSPVPATQPINSGAQPDKWCDPGRPTACFPWCARGSATDFDGDGWGFEEGKSCRVKRV